MSTNDLQVLFPNVTEVDVDVFGQNQIEYAILQQFGFWIEASVDSDFYTIGLDIAESASTLYKDGSVDASANKIYTALSASKIGYLADELPSVDPDLIETAAAWTSSTLTADATNVIVQPATNNKIGDQILNGIIGPMFTGVWGSSAVEPSNRTKLVSQTGSYNANGITLDDLMAKNLAATLNTASAAAHDEVLGHLLDQVIDISGTDNVTNNVEALEELGLTVDTSGVAAYATQDFWMKVYLDLNLNQATTSSYLDVSADYEQSLTGAMIDDDNDGVADNDDNANLVSKSASGKIVFADLNDTFLNNFKGEVHTAGGFKSYNSAAADETGAGVTVSIADDAEIQKVRVPLLIKFNVGS